MAARSPTSAPHGAWIALRDQLALAILPRGFLAAIELGAQAPEFFGAQALGVAVVELPVRALAPAQRRVHRSARARRSARRCLSRSPSPPSRCRSPRDGAR